MPTSRPVVLAGQGRARAVPARLIQVEGAALVNNLVVSGSMSFSSAWQLSTSVTLFPCAGRRSLCLRLVFGLVSLGLGDHNHRCKLSSLWSSVRQPLQRWCFFFISCPFNWIGSCTALGILWNVLKSLFDVHNIVFFVLQ